MIKRIIFVLVVFCVSKLEAQNIINGSFEQNTATTHILNLTNVQYNNTISSSSSFGPFSLGTTTGEIDLLKNGAGYSWDSTWSVNAQDGDWFIALASMGEYYINIADDTILGFDYQDAFSLELDDTLTIGSWYTLTFYIKYKYPSLGVGQIPGSLSVGISHYADSFGVIIDTSAYADTIWQQQSIQFQATDTFAHITCRPVREKFGITWPFVDNFSLRFDSTGTYVSPPVSYNCNGNNICVDPADGSGTYATLTACQAVCIASNINEIEEEKQLIKVIDILGKESSSNKKGLLFYIYSDGTVEKKVIIE